MRGWLGPIFSLVFLMPWILGNTECNMFAATADKGSDAALLFAAQEQINAADYTGAITTLAGLSAAGAATHDGLTMQASAYAGRCGLNLVTFANDVVNGISSNTLMKLLLKEMKSVTSYSDCLKAESFLLQVPAAQTTPDDDIFLAFVEFAKLGAALESSPGVDPTPSHTGVADVGFDSCNTTQITDATVRDIGYSLVEAVNAIKASNVSIVGSVTSAMTPLCGAPANLPCNASGPSAFVGYEKVVRTVIRANEMGLNTCNGASYSSLACTCP